MMMMTLVLLQEKLSGKAIGKTKPLGGRGSAPDPAGELTALPRLPGWWRGGSLPLPKNRIPAFGPSDLSSTARSRADPHNKMLRTPLMARLKVDEVSTRR